MTRARRRRRLVGRSDFWLRFSARERGTIDYIDVLHVLMRHISRKRSLRRVLLEATLQIFRAHGHARVKRVAASKRRFAARAADAQKHPRG